MTFQPAITVSRALGSGGSPIAYHVAQRLGWRYCDRSILRRTAAALGLDPADLGPREECPHSFLRGFRDDLLRMLALASPEVPYAPAMELPLYGKDLFEQESCIMRQIVATSPAVLVGRGGFIALANRPATLHVHVTASLDFRIHRLLTTHREPDEAAARRAIQVSDRNRKAFILAISGRPWNDPGNFDLVLDSSRDGFAACEAQILSALERVAPLGSELGPEPVPEP